jgi:hypothetical protein
LPYCTYFSLAFILADGSSTATSSVALSQKHKKRKVAHVEDSEVDDNNTSISTMKTSKTSTSNAAIASIALSGKKKASKLKSSGTAN